MSFWGWVKKKMDGRIIPIFFMGFRASGRKEQEPFKLPEENFDDGVWHGE